MRSQRGTTLIEVMISVLLTAIIVTSVFSVSLTAKRVGSKLDRKVAGAYQAKLLMERLKPYVTADYTTAGVGTMGPGTGGNWYLAGVSPAMVFPLAPGAHTATSMLPSALAGAPYNMTMTYTVTDPNGGWTPPNLSNYRPVVAVTINWTEP